MTNKPKILLFDLETSPMETYNWSLYQELNNTSFIKKDWYVLCWSAKWLGSKKIINKSLPDYKGYNPNRPDDKKLMKDLWNLLDKADVVMAHNAKKFDVKKANARFIMNGMTPPSPYKVIDTLISARSQFKFTSNRLDDLGEYLGLGRKLPTNFQLWLDCMAGCPKAWKKMNKYCDQDIVLLEKVYLKLRPWITNHPNLNVYIDDLSTKKPKCQKCLSNKLHKRGFSYTNACKYQRYQCVSCGGYGRGKKNLLENKIKTTNI